MNKELEKNNCNRDKKDTQIDIDRKFFINLLKTKKIKATGIEDFKEFEFDDGVL